MDYRVAVVQRVLPHYRVAFFDRLQEELERRQISLDVYFGSERPGTVPRSVALERTWAHRARNTYLGVSGHEVVWQSIDGDLTEYDLVIVEHAFRLPLNFILHYLARKGKMRLAYWGHGKNFQSAGKRQVIERIKRNLVRKVDWWFAYTELSARAIKDAGFEEERLTVVNNSIDTHSLADALQKTSHEQVTAMRNAISANEQFLCIYLGGLYAEKRIAFLLQAAAEVKKKVDDFGLVIVGDGPDAPLVIEYAKSAPWLHYVGPVFGDSTAVYLKMAKLMLMPGMVGLAIIDSFVAGVPIVTTEIPIHSPEIAYLTSGQNGLLTENSMEHFVDAILKCSREEAFLRTLEDGCKIAAEKFTLEQMVANFVKGIEACLKNPPRFPLAN